MIIVLIALIGCSEETNEEGNVVVDENKHVCSPEELTAEVCTTDYTPVCGNEGETYANGCSACSSGDVASYEIGECEELLVGGDKDEHVV